MVRIDVERADGTTTLEVHPRRIYNLGSATRATDDAVAHQEEVAEAGVRIAFDVPAPRIYPIAPWALTTNTEITVQGPHSSGEVELVLVVTEDDTYVGVGSDHTDRALEQHSIPWSKQVCQNVLAPRVWPLRDVAERLPGMEMFSTVDGAPYQHNAAGVFMDPSTILELLAERTRLSPPPYLVFCGTYAAIDRRLRYGSRWGFGLRDHVGGRTIEHVYDVAVLRDEVHDRYRVPLSVPDGH